MKAEYFGSISDAYGEIHDSHLSEVKYTYAQERDWSCGIAAVRSLLSTRDLFISEDSMVTQCHIEPGPKPSKSIQLWMKRLGYDDMFTYGFREEYISLKPAALLESLLTTHNVMIETMLNYAHWIVVLAYYKKGELRDDVVVYFDPYFNRVRMAPAEEVISMWYGIGETLIDHDFVAIKKKGCT